MIAVGAKVRTTKDVLILHLKFTLRRGAEGTVDHRVESDSLHGQVMEPLLLVVEVRGRDEDDLGVDLPDGVWLAESQLEEVA